MGRFFEGERFVFFASLPLCLLVFSLLVLGFREVGVFACAPGVLLVLISFGVWAGIVFGTAGTKDTPRGERFWSLFFVGFLGGLGLLLWRG